jgi:hypothetical protein
MPSDPLVSPHQRHRGRGDRVPDVVVIVYRVECLLLGTVPAAGAQADPQQRRVEDLLLRRGVQFKEGRQPGPDRAERSGVGPVDLLPP